MLTLKMHLANYSHESLNLLELQASSRSKARSRSKMRKGGGPRPRFYTILNLGTPPQQFLAALDTGSGNLVIPAKDCTDMACGAHRRYDRFLSTSAKDVIRVDDEEHIEVVNWPPRKDSDTMTLFYGSGKVFGRIVNDHVCVGAMTPPGSNLCTEMNFIVGESMTQEPFGLLPFDGILGLGLPALSATKKFNIMGEFAEKEMLLHDRFAMWLALPGDGEDSEITFGDFKTDRMTSHIIWTPITNHPGQTVRSGFWQVTLEDVAIANTALGIGNHQAAIDSGTSMIAGPSSMINTIEAEVALEQDCSNYNLLPTVGFVIGGTILNMEPSDYVHKDAGTQECFTQFLKIDLPPPKGPLLLLGDPFLKKYYSIFDRDTLKMGFALSKHKNQAEHKDLAKWVHEMMIVH